MTLERENSISIEYDAAFVQNVYLKSFTPNRIMMLPIGQINTDCYQVNLRLNLGNGKPIAHHTSRR